MGGVIVILLKQKKYIKLFRKVGAIDAEHSISLNDFGIRKSLVFNKMIRRGIFIQCESGKYYINNQAAEDLINLRSRRAKITIIIAVVAFLVFCIIQLIHF